MKKLLAATFVFIAVVGAPSAMANTALQSWCEGFADSQGVPRTPCTCIVAAIGDNEELAAEMMTKTSIANYHETKSAALAVAVDPCVPPRRT